MPLKRVLTTLLMFTLSWGLSATANAVVVNITQTITNYTITRSARDFDFPFIDYEDRMQVGLGSYTQPINPGDLFRFDISLDTPLQTLATADSHQIYGSVFAVPSAGGSSTCLPCFNPVFSVYNDGALVASPAGFTVNYSRAGGLTEFRQAGTSAQVGPLVFDRVTFDLEISNTVLPETQLDFEFIFGVVSQKRVLDFNHSPGQPIPPYPEMLVKAQTAPPPGTAPTPATLSLLGIGFLAMAARRGRRAA